MKKLIIACLVSMATLANAGCPSECATKPAAKECPKPRCFKTVMVEKKIMVPKQMEIPAIKKVIKQPATCRRVPEYYKVPITVYETRCRYRTEWDAQPDVVYYECPVDTNCSPSQNACPVAC